MGFLQGPKQVPEEDSYSPEDHGHNFSFCPAAFSFNIELHNLSGHDSQGCPQPWHYQGLSCWLVLG